MGGVHGWWVDGEKRKAIEGLEGIVGRQGNVSNQGVNILKLFTPFGL